MTVNVTSCVQKFYLIVDFRQRGLKVETRSEFEILTIATLLFFANQIRNLHFAHHQRLFDVPSMRSSNIDQLKALMILMVAYNFLNQMRNIRNMYFQHLMNRLPIEPRKIVKRNSPVPRTLWYYERVVLRFSDTIFRSHFRLTRNTFTNLCNLLGPIMAPNVDPSAAGRPNTPIEKQILPVLWLLATPESYRSVADRFNISKGTLVMFVNKFVDVLNDISSQYIRWPEPSEMMLVRKQFYKIARFDEWVIGAVDGTFVVIPAPKEDPEVFRTRKCNFAVTLQGICTATLRFISCFAGFPSSVGDRRIFENSPIYKNILQSKRQYFPTNEFIVGDKAYPVREWLQAPYIRRFALNEAQELYNHVLSSTRLDMSNSSNIPKTIIACCVLHNLCLSESNYEDFIQEGMSVVRDNTTTEIDDDCDRNNATSLEGERRRGEIAAKLQRKRIVTRL